VILSVLSALAIGGRAVFFALPGFKPVAAMVILTGVAFGPEAGFMVGTMTMFCSNVLFGQGPWTPWQMFAIGIIGLLSGVLFRKGLLHRDRFSLCAFGGLAIFLIYGGIMNPASILMYQPNPTWKMILTACITGVPADAIHALATVLFLWFLSEPMLEKLDRVKVKYGLMEK
jgi:energy-coupling factor transport system ATP-binding protein